MLHERQHKCTLMTTLLIQKEKNVPHHGNQKDVDTQQPTTALLRGWRRLLEEAIEGPSDVVMLSVVGAEFALTDRSGRVWPSRSL